MKKISTLLGAFLISSTLLISQAFGASVQIEELTLNLPEGASAREVGRATASKTLADLTFDATNSDSLNGLFDSLGKLEEVSDQVFYQIVIPDETGYKQAFIVSTRIKGENFSPDHWSMLFPGSNPDNTLRQLLDGTQANLAKGPVTVYQKLADSISVTYLGSYHEFDTASGPISTRAGSLLGDTHQFRIPLYGRYFGWRAQDDYRIIVICAIYGERSYWEDTFLPAMQTNH